MVNSPCKTSLSDYKVLKAFAVMAIDIDGTFAAGIDQIFFNPSGENVEGERTFEVRNLLDIKSII